MQLIQQQILEAINSFWQPGKSWKPSITLYSSQIQSAEKLSSSNKNVSENEQSMRHSFQHYHLWQINSQSGPADQQIGHLGR